ncbi:MAG: hypothetical protein DYG96_02870 [Chlorobi bacterium CHB2]|nr:hypothetical protein [Chlorobi bacterium CHB2]
MTKTIGILLIIAAIGVMAWWSITSGELWTLQKVAYTVTDPLFGTESIEWRDEFRVGLLPIVGPISAAFLVVGGLLLWRHRCSRLSHRAAIA